MITASADITIDRPVQEVFAFVTDERNHPKWDSTSVEMEALEPGPWRPGSTFREVRRIGPRTTEMRSRVADLTPGSSMDIESLTGPMFRGHWRFEAIGDATRLRWTGELQPGGAQRLLQPLIARQFRATTSANFARLKDVLEGRG